MLKALFIFAMLLSSCQPQREPDIKFIVYSEYVDILLPGQDTVYLYTMDGQACNISGILFSPKNRYKTLAQALRAIHQPGQEVDLAARIIFIN